MKKITLFICLILFVQVLSFAQAIRNCSTMHNLERLELVDPSVRANMDAVERFTNDYVASHPAGSSRVVVSIPVVVHVIYNNSTQNISDAQINSQLTILNNDFRKLNADRTAVPAVFSSLAADCEINFCLAQRTPSGSSTTGIVRVSTATTSFIDDDRVKSSSTGGDNAWDATQYLNLWVCNLGGGLLGYAQFPGGAASTDGVVINYTAFGNIGTAASPYDLGRTATHEVGHWLNLRHIWGDATCGSDLVTDTPTQSTSNFGCPAFPHVTCSNGPNGDLWMNYMDYTDDRCMYMFTTGQKTRMQALFATGGARAGLLTSSGCSPVLCTTPSGLSATSITTTSATLNWGAVAGAASYNVQYKLSSASSWTTVTASTNSKALTGLVAGSTYNYQIQTVCSASASSAYSTASTFNTASASCAVPTGLTASSITTTTATLGWTAVTGATSYNVQYKLSSASSWTTVTASTNSKALTGLVAGSTYNYQIQTVCSSSSSSSYSTAASFTTAAAACAVSTGLAAGSITSTTATLSWTAVSGAASYNVQYKLSSASSWTTVTSSTNSKALTGLVASSAYNYQIQTICSASSSAAYSTASTFTTAAPSCGADSYEPNNSVSVAQAISNNTNYLAYVCPAGDEDWYRFTTTTSARNFKVTLTTLPADYDLYVYNSGGTLIGSSTNGGTTNELFTLNGGTVGNYYIRVIGYSGATSPTIRYTLLATTSSAALRVAGEENEQVADIVNENTGYTVYPNPAADHFIASYTSHIDGVALVKVYDSMGKLITTSPFSVSPGLNQIELNTNDMNAGFYFVELQDGDAKYSTKILISK